MLRAFPGMGPCGTRMVEHKGDHSHMVRSSYRALSASLAVALLGATAVAQQESAYSLLPDTTQAVVMIPDGQKLVDNWNKTELARLSKDDAVAPFFEEQRQEIEKRFIDAGWRLNVKPDDIRGFLTGEVAVAWLKSDGNARKPFAMTMIADVAKDEAANQEMLDKIDAELSERKAAKKELRVEGVNVFQYTMQPPAGEILVQNTFYAIDDGKFIATDDKDLIEDLIGQIKSEAEGANRLLTNAEFVASRERLDSSLGRDPVQVGARRENDIEYFARPLGFAEVLRSIGGNRSKNGADMIAILKNQGFGAIQAVTGVVRFGGQQLDVMHRGYVLAEFPLPLSAGVLDFPNKASRELPNFVSDKISSLLVTNWNANEAFWKVEGLVDEIAGTPQVFEEVIEGFHKDTNGPQVDIRNDVLPHFANDIYSISDAAEGEATVESRRNLIALKLKDAAALSKEVDRAMKNEPDAKKVDFNGQTIWKVVRNDDDSEFGEFDDFDDFDDEEDDQGAEDANGPWLSDWAITVSGDYLLFASHAEMIEEAIELAAQNEESPLERAEDYVRVRNALANTFGEDNPCAWNIVRTDKAYRVQYELFRQGKLNQSQSMLASILDRLLQNQSEIRTDEQRVKGQSLPPFEVVAKFLQPSAMLVRTTGNGWEFGSVMLAPSGKDDKTVCEQTIHGTARLTNVGGDVKF